MELLLLPTVTAVDVDLDAGQVAVTSDAALDESKVAAAIDEAGYELVKN
jgi:copper chaperone CopZ